MKTYTVLFVLAFLLSYLGTPLLRRLLTRHGLLDSVFPQGPHERRPIPRLGGVVVYFALLVSLLALFIPDNLVTDQFRAELPTLWMLWGPATLVLLLGVADDIWGVNPWAKLSVQLVAALWLVLAGAQISKLSTPWGAVVELGALSIPVTLLWLVGVTNAFNLIDGLDGLAAGVSFLSATAIAATAAMVNDKIVVVVTVALAGALLGFLRHNFNPATILLGDSGSLFIGFLLAASAVVWQQKATVAVAVAAPLVAFALPVTDTAVSMMRRYLRGQPLFTSDRQHIHHRLVALGFSPRQAVLVLYALSAVAALGCILIARGHNFLTAMVLLLFIAACWIGLRRLSYPEFIEVGRAFNRQLHAARGRLQEAAELVRGAASRTELQARMENSLAALGLDLIEVHRGGAPWIVPAGTQNERMWRLSLPLGGGGRLVLGRNGRPAEAGLPLEELGRELGAALEASLARLEPEASRAEVAESEPVRSEV
ncbi:MAG TPA: MraY family glycosyltransferase [Candidatus Xenobia bacterium]|nr:MraY family glycosyltransferase [Candidatus Xenobia bacterium]